MIGYIKWNTLKVSGTRYYTYILIYIILGINRAPVYKPITYVGVLGWALFGGFKKKNVNYSSYTLYIGSVGHKNQILEVLR